MADADDYDDKEDEEEGDAGSRAVVSTDCAESSTGNAAMMAKLCEIQAQGNESKHEYGFAGNPSSTCGVCSSMWEPKCGWEKGKGNWACFSCQVYLCKWDCLNIHNKEGKGNTVRGKAVIYTKEEWAAKQEED